MRRAKSIKIQGRYAWVSIARQRPEAESLDRWVPPTSTKVIYRTERGCPPLFHLPFAQSPLEPLPLSLCFYWGPLFIQAPNQGIRTELESPNLCILPNLSLNQLLSAPLLISRLSSNLSVELFSNLRIQPPASYCSGPLKGLRRVRSLGLWFGGTYSWLLFRFSQISSLGGA